ncbi:MAG: ABC transporter ATP-binding protein [Euryarchaeota archaeon TMED85]|nr:MAG: ABC transporter ATP-binding protein [Euryarchaeota archaeon]RAH09113.1 MAG: ABC transporter ATP-binding protein [Euryarchaeota archaeon]RPG73556.1 MAG: ABC transporter ATP-binding protein [Euryarchaeota archaeon TMED85]RPG75232.1 MAG: ABC transporter ATP-binding protein [Euryarchaeota archaeon TMED85]|tara:strand:+ start:1903 stop:2595 length:693 start_codon:yes stop_codon:yes gene_type:complete
MGEILRAVDLWKVYPMGDTEVSALRGVSLEISKGEILAITGPSGSGKTTLLNCLSSLDTVSRGEIYFEEKDISNISDNERTKLRGERMGFIFQQYQLIPVLTAVENVELPLLLLNFPADEARKKALESLSTLGLSNRSHHKPSELSGGQQQRVAIARAIVHNPKILFADEPTGNLDSDTSDSVVQALEELNRIHGITVVIVTHDTSVSKRCNRILVINDGILSETNIEEE